MDNRDKWYPKEVYNRDENITRRNKEEYDRLEDLAWQTIDKIEADLGYGLSIEDHVAICKLYHEGKLNVRIGRS